MVFNIAAIVAVVLFYIAILILGVVAGWKTSRGKTNETVIVADRSFGIFVALFTLTATNVGGGFINGTAEATAVGGLLNLNAPLCFCVTGVFSALTYVPKIRKAGYVTVYDPYQLKYGRKVGALMILPEIVADMFWAAAILYALGATLSVILDIDSTLSIIISAAVVAIYTFFGGLYSVAYTDIIQLFFIVIGLVISVPFVLTNPAVDLSQLSDISSVMGTIPQKAIWTYIDTILLCILGGSIGQPFNQRVLACKSNRIALISLIGTSIFSALLIIPPALIGLVGRAADWNQTDYVGPIPLPESKNSFMLPLVLNYLTPLPVAVIGVGAVAAAVMSSADSCILAGASVFTKNLYQDVIRPKASQQEIEWILRFGIMLMTVASTLLAILSGSVIGLFILCVDLLYIIQFPQLFCVLFIPYSNAYGCVSGYFVGLILRILSGEPVLELPAMIHYPLYDNKTNTQNFPFRTFAMLMDGLTIISVSIATNALFHHEIIPARYDMFKCTAKRTAEIRRENVNISYPKDEGLRME